MADFHIVPGFEDVWRPPVRPRQVRPEGTVSPRPDMAPRVRLQRIVARAPEVMVKATGRVRQAGHLKAHLDYISRNGVLPLQDRDGCSFEGRAEVAAIAEDWEAWAGMDARRGSNSPVSLSLVLSMPQDTDPIRLRDAAADFGGMAFGGRFDWVMALHTDADHPHVHMSVRALAIDGARLNPKKADLAAWRQLFAETLRDRGVEAEATPRRARGVVRKSERMAVRRLRERYERGEGAIPRTVRAGVLDAAHEARRESAPSRPWEQALLQRQRRVRGVYLAQIAVLSRSSTADDRDLAAELRRFLDRMPPIQSLRANWIERLRSAREPGRPEPGRSR